MQVRGIRGATTVSLNTEDEILCATRALLEEMVAANSARVDELGAALFTVTNDLNAAFPAKAARQLGWVALPMLDATEVPVPGSLRRCIRVMLWWNTDRPAVDIRHVYQREALSLRPDLVPTPTDPEELQQ
jgi:chorismate mutase